MKKGFTLIELLAVLVVLAILALISIPITIKIINSARENSYKRSIASYAKAFELAIANDSMMDSDKGYKALTEYNVETMYSGNRVQCDLDESTLNNGKLVLRYCQVNDSKYYKYENGDIILETLYDVYEVGDLIRINGEYYNVIKGSSKSKDYVMALKEVPISYDDVVTYGQGYINKNVSDYSGAPANGTPIKGNTYGMNTPQMNFGGVAYYSSETCGSTGCKTNYNESDIKHIVDNWAAGKFTDGQLKLVDGKEARLLHINDLLDLGYTCEISYCPKNDSIPNWIYYNPNYYYWIDGFTDNVYTMGYLNSGGQVGQITESYFGGAVRPVINVYKNAIE